MFERRRRRPTDRPVIGGSGFLSVPPYCDDTYSSGGEKTKRGKSASSRNSKEDGSTGEGGVEGGEGDNALRVGG